MCKYLPKGFSERENGSRAAEQRWDGPLVNWWPVNLRLTSGTVRTHKNTLHFSPGLDELTPFQRPKVTAASRTANSIPRRAFWFSSDLARSSIMELWMFFFFFNSGELSAPARVPTSSWVPWGTEGGMAAQFVLYAFVSRPNSQASLHSCYSKHAVPPPLPRLPKFQQKRTKQRCFNPCLLDQLQVQDQLLSAVFTGS